MSTTTKPRFWKEGRRMRAFELKEQGWKQIDIAKAPGVTRGAVSQWFRRAQEGGGIEALRHRSAPGPTPRLTTDQLARLPELLSKGAEYYGFIGQVWTGSGVAILKVPLTRDHLSAISAITQDGDLYLCVQARSYRGPDVVRFLEHLLRHVPGLLTIIWDGAPIHRAQVVKQYLSNGDAKRIHLEQLLGYAPDLNPDEGIWRYLKRVELRNLCCSGFTQLRRELRLAVGRLRHRRHIIKSCIKEAGYHV